VLDRVEVAGVAGSGRWVGARVGVDGVGLGEQAQAAGEVVADRAQLGGVEDPADGTRGGGVLLVGDREAPDVALVGERELEPADLLTQPAAVGRGVVGGGGGRHAAVQRGGEVAGIEAGGLRGLHGVAGDVGEPLVGRGVVADERAAAVPGGDQALGLEAGVDRADRVDVDAGGGGEIADAGQAVPAREVARDDPRAQRPGQLHGQRNVAVAVELDVHRASIA
jgi:hypothetical protein